MRRFIRCWFGGGRGGDEGFSLVWLALVLTVLLGMAGLAVDLGWLYFNSVRTQSAVDAAALAGVVNLPGSPYTADAEAAARANGYDPGGADTLDLNDNGFELYAELSTDVPLFFMRVLGFRNQTITRDATAQYVRPVPLGNPDNCFGGGPGTGCSTGESFWAAVNGRRTMIRAGDPFSTECFRRRGGFACDGNNALYARGGSYAGYYYAVEVFPTTTNLKVEIYDGAFQSRPITKETGDFYHGGGPPPVDTTFSLYRPDGTPHTPEDHSPSDLICSETSSRLAVNAWDQLCSTISRPTQGLYLVHVETTTNSSGSNSFSIKATSDGETPRVYGINDMSILFNDSSGASELYLAEIGPEHAGKKLEIQFFDAGDARGSQAYYSVLDPHGNTPECEWTVWTHDFTSQHPDRGTQVCRLQMSDGSAHSKYEEHWMRVLIDLPDDPDAMCDGDDCWWKMGLELPVPTDRTTWTARVIGNPVRLLP